MTEETASGIIFALSGPSGVGKTSLTSRLKDEQFPLAIGVTATTRQPRAHEVQGRDYYFYSVEEFERLRSNGELLEWVQQHGDYYGTPKSVARDGFLSGLDLMLVVDVEGAAALKRAFPQAVLIFLSPPSFESLAERLQRAEVGGREKTSSRLAKARKEMERVSDYDYVVVNQENRLHQATEAVKAIVVAERHRVEPRVSQV